MLPTGSQGPWSTPLCLCCPPPALCFGTVHRLWLRLSCSPWPCWPATLPATQCPLISVLTHPPALACGPTIMSSINPDGLLRACLESSPYLVGSRLELWGQLPPFHPDAQSIQVFDAPCSAAHLYPRHDPPCTFTHRHLGGGGCWGQSAGAPQWGHFGQ